VYGDGAAIIAALCATWSWIDTLPMDVQERYDRDRWVPYRETRAALAAELLGLPVPSPPAHALALRNVALDRRGTVKA
jgi:hypothetical protein